MPGIQLTLNGDPIATSHSDGAALDLIRDTLGLTGTKLVCGIGGCGACTVLVDGVPTETCTLEPTALDGREITTIEGHSASGELTPLQRAMVAHDAVQCGFCTPGLVLAAETFVAGWRDRVGATRPERSDVANALDGHLCRCGAYPGILSAVQSAAAGEHDAPATADGRPDAVAKLTGEARFTVDITLDGMLEGKIVRSTVPHAEVVGLDTAGALAIPGVRAVVDLLLKERTVHYVGQPIAAVAAEDKATAEAGVDAIDITYKELPSAVGMEAARAKDAPILFDGRMFLTSNSEVGLVAATLPRKGNMRGPMGLLAKRRFTARRRIKNGRAQGDPLLVEGVWKAASQAHAALEPHSAVATWDGDELTMYVSTQSVSATARKLAKRFGVPKQNVRVIAEHVGGAFGAKQGLPEPSVAAGELARAASAPVRIVFDAEEELAYGGHRPGADIELSVLGGADGSLKAISAKGHMDSGDSIGQIVVGMMRFSYPGPPMSLDDYDVISNGAPARPFQAPGAPIALYALESAVDELAKKTGTDPVTMRRGWNPRHARQVLYDWVESHPLWMSRHEGVEGKLRGVGVAFGLWHYAYDPGTVVRLSNDESGLTVETGAQEQGTGTTTILAKAVASEFGIEAADVHVRIGDSTLPHGPTASASRSTPSVFPAAGRAAAELKAELMDEITTELGMDGAKPSQGGIEHAGEFIPWLDLWPRLPARSVSAKRPRDDRLSATPFAVEGVRFGYGISDVAHIVEVEVDQTSGHVAVTRVAAALAAGTIHTPAQARSQIHGALARGIGEALLEERLTDATSGEVVTAAYDKYRILRASEMPEVEVEFFEEGFVHAAGGGAGISELSITSVPAAVANAVAAATGWRPMEMPMTPERVLAGMDSSRTSQPGARKSGRRR